MYLRFFLKFPLSVLNSEPMFLDLSKTYSLQGIPEFPIKLPSLCYPSGYDRTYIDSTKHRFYQFKLRVLLKPKVYEKSKDLAVECILGTFVDWPAGFSFGLIRPWTVWWPKCLGGGKFFGGSEYFFENIYFYIG